MRFIGRREGIGRRSQRQMDWAEEETADNDRITLFVAFNYGGRAEILDAAARFEGGDEEEFRGAALRARDARPRPDHPHQRRAAALQLPALAVGLLGARLPRRAVARLHARGLRGVAERVRRAAAPLRRPVACDGSGQLRDAHLRASEARPRAAPLGAARARDRGAPALAVASVIVWLGGLLFAIALLMLGWLPRRALPHDGARTPPTGSPASSRCRAAGGGALRRRATRCC
jgi:hypothetical protein